MTVHEYRVKRAINYAKAWVLSMAPELEDPEIRKNMSRIDKLRLINTMLELADEDYNRVEEL